MAVHAAGTHSINQVVLVWNLHTGRCSLLFICFCPLRFTIMSGFDVGAVYFSAEQEGRNDTLAAGNYNATKRLLKEFLKEFHENNFIYTYRDEVKRHCNLRQYYVTVRLQHLASYSPEMSQTLAQQPTEIMPIFEEAAREIADEVTRPRPNTEEQMPPMQVLLSSHAKPVAMRDLKADLVCRLVRLTGIVLSVSSVRAKATQLSLQCRSCRACLSNLPVRPGLEGYALPRKCITDAAAQGRPKCPLDPFFIVPDRCHCVDFQLVKLQEAPEAVPHGETPRHMQVYLDRYQCDRIAPGNRVSVVGVYSVRGQAPKGSGNMGGPGVRATYVRALGVALEESSHGIGGAPSDEEEEEFRRLAAKPDIQERLARSIAPSILGSVDVKKAICCLLFGGSRKRMPDGLYRRGDINVLLLGDPGTAKSQLLKFVEKCAPIAVYTSGKGSSAAGLTASVIRDPSSRGFVMEGGAMVLADGGVVAIDEFDKMREDDRVAIHEAMEQQTISVAKAGITTTLNSRCSVLAAANSVFGRWDETRAAGENIDFMPTILSRFDMIFIVKDEHSEARDTEMARHVLQVHLRGGAFGAATEAAAAGGAAATPEDEVPLDKLRRYISFCRDRCGPRLSEAAAARLENAYVAMRGDAKEMETAAASSVGGAVSGKHRQVIPITVRQLEALVRISESLAKMRLAPFATEADVEEALRLFRVSTLDAAKEGSLAGAEGFTSQHDHEQLVQAERQVKRRFLIGSQVSESTIVTDFVRQGYPEPVVQKVLSLMLRRGEIQYRMQRRILYRVK